MKAIREDHLEKNETKLQYQLLNMTVIQRRAGNPAVRMARHDQASVTGSRSTSTDWKPGGKTSAKRKELVFMTTLLRAVLTMAHVLGTGAEVAGKEICSSKPLANHSP